MSLRTVLALALLGVATAPAQVTRGMEPDLGKIELPVLGAAHTRPEALWTFLVDPATPFDHALAAADRCRDVFTLPLLEPLMRARAELHREHLLHWFGFRQPDWALLPEPTKDVARERHMLGRDFTVPATKTPYPTSWDEAAKAPWPWRVMHVLDRTLRAVEPVGHEREQPRTCAWLAECMRWRIDDEESATIFFEATLAAQHTKTLPVLARWRRILLAPNLPQIAGRRIGRTRCDSGFASTRLGGFEG